MNPLSEKVRTAVLEAKARGCSEPQALAEVKAAGMRCSAGSVHNIYAGAAGRRGPRGGVAKGAGRPVAGSTVTQPTTQVDPDDVVGLLRQSCADIQELAALAKASSALPEFASLSRTLNQTVALAARLAPPPPADPNANPDMREAAKRAREKLHDMIDRALEDVA